MLRSLPDAESWEIGAVMAERRRPLPADFWRLWTASSISAVGDGVRAAALPLLAAGLTRDPQTVALVGVAGGLPWLLLALPAGALVDRWDRKRTMWTVDFARAAVMGLLAAAVLTGSETIPLLLAVAFLLGSGWTLFDSAAQAALPVVVPAEGLERANGRLSAGLIVGGAFAGAPLGGFLFALMAAVPFGFDAASFLVAALLALRLRADLAVRSSGEAPARLRAQIAEGLRFLWGHRELRAICILLTVWNLVENGVFAILVLWALEVLRVPEGFYGVLLAGLAVGGVAGSLVADRLGRALGTGRGFAIALWGSVATYAGLGFTSDGAVAFALLAVLGASAMLWNVLSAAFRQAVVPNRLMGRVNSVYRGATWGVIPVGAALGGFTADHLGLRAPFLLAAALLVVATALALPHLRSARLAAARAAAVPEG
jgi:MFS family permease